jgi:hypothetical protein
MEFQTTRRILTVLEPASRFPPPGGLLSARRSADTRGDGEAPLLLPALLPWRRLQGPSRGVLAALRGLLARGCAGLGT